MATKLFEMRGVRREMYQVRESSHRKKRRETC